MDLASLTRLNNILGNKGFRDKHLKFVQYTAKCFLDCPYPAPAEAPANSKSPATPNSLPESVRTPLKVLSGHISAARRLYRFGQLLRGLESFIKAVTDTSKPLHITAKAIFMGFASFWTDVFDSMSYYKMVMAGDRTFADYWSSFFYVTQLSVGAWDQVLAFLANLNRTAEIKVLLKNLRASNSKPSPADNINNSSNSVPNPAPVKSEADLKAELAALSWKRFEIVLDLIRRIGDGLTAMKSLSAFFSDKNFTVALGGAIGGAIGSWQTSLTIK